MDNLVVSVDSLTQAHDLYDQLTEKSASAGFNLGGWTSNSAAFCQSLPAEMTCLKEGNISILKLDWNRGQDTLFFRFEETRNPPPATFSTPLSALAEVYDLLGLVTPCLVGIKAFIQDCWKEQKE